MVIAGMTITDDRNESATFSMPYYKADQALVVLKSNTDILSTADLAGKVVAVNTGTTGQYYIEDNLPDVGEMKPYGTASDTFQAERQQGGCGHHRLPVAANPSATPALQDH